MAVAVLLGPTAAGKTGLAMAVQDFLGGPDKVQLISVDSAMVYRGMDIGTAKPTVAELEQHPHALIDIRDPSEIYSAADFVRDADAAVRDAEANGRLPLLVGGTMMYARCFLFGIAELPETDSAVRAELEQEWLDRGGEALHAELTAIDPQAAEGIATSNRQRLLRALEVVRTSGRKISDLWQENAGQTATERLHKPVKTIAMPELPRSELHQRIEMRFDQMLVAGFLDEVRALKARDDLRLDLPSMRAVGYRQAWLHLDGQVGAEQFRADGLTASRRLAKRQLTWLRSWPELQQLPESPVQQQIEQVAKLLTLT